eukprot:891333-Rhodomonas_salina.1
MSIVMGLEVLLRHCSSSLLLMHEMIFFESAAGLVLGGKRFVFSQAFALLAYFGVLTAVFVFDQLVGVLFDINAPVLHTCVQLGVNLLASVFGMSGGFSEGTEDSVDGFLTLLTPLSVMGIVAYHRDYLRLLLRAGRFLLRFAGSSSSSGGSRWVRAAGVKISR